MNAPNHPYVLLLVSNPLIATDPVAVDEALERLSSGLRSIRTSATFVTRIAEPDGLGSYLARGDRPRFSVLHYLGHGAKPKEDPEGYLIFEGQTGDIRPLDPLQLRLLLNPTNCPQPEFRLAVVMACHSESVARTFSSLGIPHIVSVEADESVYQWAAITFFCRFYEVLLTGDTVQAAFSAGCNAVALDEVLNQQGTQAALAEARKFKLLPEDADHDEPLWPALRPGQVVVEPLPTLTDSPFHQRPAHFIGRGEEMQEVLARLRERRAVLIQGVSGVGKTELARETARWLVARRRPEADCVAFVSLSGVHDADNARREIAIAVGLPPASISHDAALAQGLKEGLLLILDEVENAVLHDGFAFRNLLEALIASPARPRLIVTSQSDVGSAHLPRYELHRLTPDAALRLFVLEAAVTTEEWERMEEKDLVALLDTVDRIPRAVVLVARAWRHSRSSDLKPLLADLKEKWDQVMRDPLYPDQVKSVAAGIGLAYSRLKERSPDAAALYPYLALFPGGLPETGVEPIFGPQGRDRIAEMEQQSMLERPWPDLLYLPTPFRLFAARLLGDEGAARASLGEAVLRFYFDFDEEPHVGWIKVLDRGLREGGDMMPAAIARYAYELPGIEAWVEWGLEHEPCRKERVRAPRIIALLENLYTVTGLLYQEETFRRYQRALNCARRCKDRLGEANTLRAIGDVLRFRDEYDRALETYREALGLFRAVGDRLGEANTLQAIGDVLRFRAEYDRALETYREALGLFRAVGARLGEANTLQAIGDVLRFRDEYDRALETYGEALGLYRAVGARLGEANTLRAIGDVLSFRKEMKEALETYGEALGLYRAVGDRLGEANTLASLSRLSLRRGDDAQARALLQQAVDLHAAIGSRYDVAADLGNFGLVLRELGRLEEARPYLLQAAEIFDEIGLSQAAAQVRQAAGEALQAVPLHPAVARMAPLLLGVAAVARGEAEESLAQQVREALEQMGHMEDWGALSRALSRILEGERDPQSLAQGLDEIDLQALLLTLAALEDERARTLLRALAETAETTHEIGYKSQIRGAYAYHRRTHHPTPSDAPAGPTGRGSGAH